MQRLVFIFLAFLLVAAHASAVPKTTLMKEDVGYCNVFDGQPTAQRTGTTIAARITALAGAPCTLVLGGRPSELPGAWTVSSTLIIPDTITLLIPDGTTITGAGALTIPRLLASTHHGWYTGTGVLTIIQYLHSPQPVLLPAILCNDTGNQAPGINAAIAAIPANGAIILLPTGICRITQALSTIPAGSTLKGYGRFATTLMMTSATATAITLSGNGAAVRDFTLDGSGRTTGIGILATNAGQQYLIEGVYVARQGIGIQNEGAATEIRNTLVDHCVSSGIYLNGNARSQDEVHVINVQSNNNGGHGLLIVGGTPGAAGAGIRIDKYTAAGNVGTGLLSNPGTSGWSVGAVWINDLELSGNGINLQISAGLNSLGWVIHGGLYESAANWNVYLDGGYHILTGAVITNAGTVTPGNGMGIAAAGNDIVIANNIVLTNAQAGVAFGAASSNITLSNNEIRQNGIGLRFDPGSTAVVVVGGRMISNTTLYLNAIPTGSIIAAVQGFDNFLQGGVQTSAPTAGTAKTWKLGAAAVVSPTAPNRTIEVEVDGVTLYISAKTTNN